MPTPVLHLRSLPRASEPLCDTCPAAPSPPHTLPPRLAAAAARPPGLAAPPLPVLRQAEPAVATPVLLSPAF